ncbi:MAG: DUF2510 domain-containing protein [Acidobacteria bacterium]|nr:DUF2510 domain-containing protein [Acidobacteriota bacterium]
MSDQPAALPPANWYPAPDRAGQLRWWDGTAWSEQYAAQDPAAERQAAQRTRRAEKDAGHAAKLAEKEHDKNAKAYAHATAAYQSALATWQAQRDAQAAQWEEVSTFEGDVDGSGLLLKAGERLFAKIDGAALIEERAGQGEFVGRSQGISIPIGSLGGHSLRYRVGSSRGHYVAGPPVQKAVDTGTLYVTNQRVVFAGSNATRECPFSKLLSYQTSPNGLAQFSVSTRQKPTVVEYGTAIAASFDQHLEIALARFNGTTQQLVDRAKAALDAIDASRPVAPTAPTE